MIQSLTKNRNQVKRVTVTREMPNVAYASPASFGGCSRFDTCPGGGFLTALFRSIAAFESVAYRVKKAR